MKMEVCQIQANTVSDNKLIKMCVNICKRFQQWRKLWKCVCIKLDFCRTGNLLPVYTNSHECSLCCFVGGQSEMRSQKERCCRIAFKQRL